MQRTQEYIRRFDATMQRLNESQKEAVESIEGPVMVIAGPGTGKTQVLIMRIAYILRTTHVQPHSIIALTFTHAAVTNIQERLANIVGPVAYSVGIYTFHEFCQHIITDNPDDFAGLLGSSLADDVTKIQLIETILDAQQWNYLRPWGSPYHYVKSVLETLSTLKREGITPQDLLHILDKEQSYIDAIPDAEKIHVRGSAKGKIKAAYQTQQKNINKNRELYMVYKEYIQKCRELKIYDYDDLIVESLALLKNDQDFCLRVQERYQYLLVDEHQDSNNAQNMIIRLIGSFYENPNIFVVGDEKQAIYRFQGASVENFRSFLIHYPHAKQIYLTKNYRSTQTILDVGALIMPTDNNQKLTSCTKDNAPIHIITCDSIATEMQWIGKHIQTIIQTGIAPNKIAILVKKRAYVQPIIEALKSNGVGVAYDAPVDVFRDPKVKTLLAICDYLVHYGDPEKLFHVCMLYIFDITPITLYKLAQETHKNRADFTEAVAKTEDQSIRNVHVLCEKWIKYMHNESALFVLRAITNDAGILKSALQDQNPIASIAPLRALFDEIQLIPNAQSWNMKTFFLYIQKLQEHNLPLEVRLIKQDTEHVKISTTHGVKGLEYDVVYIPTCTQNHWAGRKPSRLIHLPAEIYQTQTSAEDDNTDNARLFFVALTRARSAVYISKPTSDLQGSILAPCQYIDIIHPQYITQETVTHAQIEQKIPLLSKQISTSSPATELVQLTRMRLAQEGFSVSALNNYLTCPWKYFYVNLVRIPQGKTKVLLFGNAIHDCLTRYLNWYKETGVHDIKKLQFYLAFAIQKQQFESIDIPEITQKASLYLETYVRQRESLLHQNLLSPYHIHGVMVNNIKLTGEIDLVLFDKKRSQAVHIVDFKTGNPKTRNEILGETKNATGDYWRQLVFYSLLLKYFAPQYSVAESYLEFVQPVDNNVVSHSFSVSSADVQQLEQQISQVTAQINSLAFWHQQCQNTACQWCALRFQSEKATSFGTTNNE